MKAALHHVPVRVGDVITVDIITEYEEDVMWWCGRSGDVVDLGWNVVTETADVRYEGDVRRTMTSFNVIVGVLVE